MKQRTIEWSMFLTLVAAGAIVRYAFRDVPNFAPVAATALFAGIFFRHATMAVCVPLFIMGLTDPFVGFYDGKMMALVYSALVFPIALRSCLRRWLSLDGSLASMTLSLSGLLGCSLASSAFFFLVTNFGCWLWFDMYEPSLSGLLHCYASALPFFRYTLYGDLGFAVVLFGSFAAAKLLVSRDVPLMVPADQ